MLVLMDDRQAALQRWACAALGLDVSQTGWQAVAGEASARRYFRLLDGSRTLICADAPPATEKNAEFLMVQSLLAAAGLPVPELLASDLQQGYLLMEDFGRQHLEDALDRERPPPDYLGALDLLLRIQAVAVPSGTLPDYDAALLGEEFGRFQDWFCESYLRMTLGQEERDVLSELGRLLIEDAQAQPRVLVYRDYMCRNLLLKPGGGLGLIDFQDAVVGPLCYDLASLLKDCYLVWPPAQVRAWALDYRRRLLEAGREAADSDAVFLQWFDWIGLHRHLKVLGNFTRLSLRDGKHTYLKEIPLVLQHIGEVLPRYPAFGEFSTWWQQRLAPRLAQVDWQEAAP